jgi:uncharacterized membrane protein YraQ (UPF0718 family)
VSRVRRADLLQLLAARRAELDEVAGLRLRATARRRIQASGRGNRVGPLVGPIVAMLSFVCSIGNVPLAAVLWNGGISFRGVIAFIFADLIVLSILNILFLVLAVVLLVRFFRTNGLAMLRMMNRPMPSHHHAEHPRHAS